MQTGFFKKKCIFLKTDTDKLFLISSGKAFHSAHEKDLVPYVFKNDFFEKLGNREKMIPKLLYAIKYIKFVVFKHTRLLKSTEGWFKLVTEATEAES